MTVQYGFIGFDGVPFTILSDDRAAVYPDWEQPHDEAIFRIYDSNITVVQDLGVGLATWAVTLSFDSMASYLALKAKQRTVGTLTVYAGYTSARGTAYHNLGVDWENLDDVELVRLTNARIETGHEWVEAEALFRRSMDPLTGLSS